MGLADALNEPILSPHAKRYKVDLILDKLADTDAAALRAALTDDDQDHVRIARILTANGHPCTEKSVSSWRYRNVPGWRRGHR